MNQNFKRQMQRGLSVVLAGVMGLTSALSVGAVGAEPEVAAPAAGVRNIKTSAYTAQLNLDQDKLNVQYSGRPGSENWDTNDSELAPGRTLLLDKNNSVLEMKNKTTQAVLDGATEQGGPVGLKMSGDVTGTKSWFFFGDEIVCLGAGIGTDRKDGNIVQVVDNINVTSDTKAFLGAPNIGYRTPMNDARAGKKWDALRDKAVLQNRTKESHLTASGFPADQKNNLDWRYLFTSCLKDARVFARIPTQADGNPKSLELWAEPVNSMYQYTMAAGGTNGGSTMAANKILSNTEALQAVEHPLEHTVMVNKWADGAVEVPNTVANLSLNQAAAVTVKQDMANNLAMITVTKPAVAAASAIDLTVALPAQKVEELNGTHAMTKGTIEGGKVHITLDTSKMNGPVTIQATFADMKPVEDTELTMVRGENAKIVVADTMVAPITWSTGFEKNDGTLLRTAGYDKKKWELKDGETDGTRVAGPAPADHLLNVAAMGNSALLTAQNKGEVVVIATDSQGQEQRWKVSVLYEDPANLPASTPEDYANIRNRWRETFVGSKVGEQPGGAEILADTNKKAKAAWDSYAYKGQTCTGIPWPDDEGKKGNKKVPYTEDAAEFRPAFQKVKNMARAYAMEGTDYYKNKDLMADMTNILDYLCTTCYNPKTQTDNWWTWEIGLPADLIPTLIMIYDDLTPEQIKTYTSGMYFFQPDPFHEGVIGIGSTHAQGYREAQGANITNCATTALGLGVLRQDSELVYLGMLASSQTFVIHEVEDSTKLAATGYDSGFYADGSYLDHGRVPYLGSYGIVFTKDASQIPSWLAGTPWAYPPEIQRNLESYVLDGYAYGIYNGMMLDCFKGRSVSRAGDNNRAAGRKAMSYILQMVNSFSESAQKETKALLKAWMQADPGFVDSLTGVGNLGAKKMALQILNDASIQVYAAPVHRTYPLMDRAIHRTNDYLIALSMYSERIQNTEIMNHENRCGWHQGNGMTYIYDKDEQYTENYWNTVNPLRLPGTTVAAVTIDNGAPDGSGFIQGGDFTSNQSWVGGSVLGEYGINGMAFSGVTSNTTQYAPNLFGKKSWFFFDDEVVCLGAGITNSGMNNPVETTIENRKLNADGSNAFVVDGQPVLLAAKEATILDEANRTADLTGETITNPTWAHLAGTKAVGTGYYFPENTTIQARHARTTGKWSDIGTDKDQTPFTQDYLELWVDHGANPTDASYSYVLLPNKSAEETQRYAADSQIEILENTADVQAVVDHKLQLTGINFWNAATAAGVTSDKPASVMIQETPNGFKVAASDPTMKETGAIKITLTGKGVSEAIQMDSNASFELVDENTAVLTFNMAKTNGTTSVAEVRAHTHNMGEWAACETAEDEAVKAHEGEHYRRCMAESCGLVEYAAHDYTETVVKEATCTAAGEKTYTCSVCNYSYTEEIPATGHSFAGDWVKEDETNHSNTCTICGEKIVEAHKDEDGDHVCDVCKAELAVPTETPVPEVTPEPETTPEPDATPAPEVTPEPEATAEPTAEPTVAPEPTEAPVPTATPEPAVTPEPAATAEPQTAAPAPVSGDDMWMKNRKKIAETTAGGNVLVSAGSEIAVPHYIWQSFYGKDVTVTIQRGSERFVFNGLDLAATGFNPDTGHNLTDLTSYVGRSYQPAAVAQPVVKTEPTAKPSEEAAATEEPEATEEPAATEEPTATPEPTQEPKPEATEEPEDVSAAAEKEGGFNWIWMVIILFVIVGAVAVGVVMFISKKRGE